MPGRMEANEETQSSTRARTHRPESRASSNSKLTPQSSNSSSANLQNRTQTGARDRERTQDRLPSSDRREPVGGSLLQERIREKKAARLSERRRSTDVDALMEEGVGFSSPRNGASSRAGRDRDGRPGSSGERTVGKKGMGIKEMEDAVSTLHKQNFDLKLELYHRRERQAALEERLEATEAQIAEQAEIQAINEQLLAELEKRDQAVEEAVGIICALEERIERMSEEHTVVRSFNAQYDSGYFKHSHEKYGQSSPDQSTTSPDRNGQTGDASNHRPRHSVASKSVARMPSFLSEQSEGAEALRSLYLPSDQQSQSLRSLPQLQEEIDNKDDAEDIRSMDSPRLSVLSESSFLSVYGEKSLALEGLDLVDGGAEVASPARGRHRKSLSIERWVDERANAAGSRIQRPPAPRSHSTRSGQFPSINNILESPLQRLEKLERTLSRHNGINSISFLAESVSTDPRGSGTRHGTVVDRDTVRKTEMTTFESQQTLPPTPDTISTSTLRRFKNSNETLGRTVHDHGRGGERSQLSHPNNASTYSVAMSGRPHSAGETVTSRREGHGWDTVTQSEYTETNSDVDVEVSSTFDPWIAMGREKVRPRIQPPDMFTFGSDDSDEWGRDMMFNRDNSSTLPRLRNREFGTSHTEEPRSEDTVMDISRLDRSQSANGSSLYPSSGAAFANQPIPNPPERRSSLAHSPGGKDKKNRKADTSIGSSDSRPTTQHATAPAATTTTQTQGISRRYRITSKIFGLSRSESQHNPPPPQTANVSLPNPTSFTRSKSYTTTDPHAAKRNSTDASASSATRATPPPILRYPIRRDGVGVRIIRPTSSSSLDSKLRSSERRNRNATAVYDDGFGVDGAGDERVERRGGKGGKEERGVSVQGLQGISAVTRGENKPSQQQGGRKWFGLGRSGSLRR